jgi:hypothetical protein
VSKLAYQKTITPGYIPGVIVMPNFKEVKHMQTGMISQLTGPGIRVSTNDNQEIIQLLRQINEKLDTIAAKHQSSVILNAVSPEEVSKRLSDPEMRKRMIEILQGKRRDNQ